MSVFTSIDLSELPPPSLVEALDYEVILAATKNELKKIAPEIDIDSILDSDPVSKILQVMAYREMHLRQRINESAQGVMLATASGSNLDNLAALVNIERLLIEAGDLDAGIDPIYEDDERLKARTQLAFEGFSTAGPKGAYLFHALSASPLVKDVAVYSELPGEVEVRLLSGENDGTASGDLITTVANALNADEIRPITDLVKVTSADIVPYTIRARLILSPGVGSQEILASARAAAQTFINKHWKLGTDITHAALLSALYRPGVQNIELHEPSADILIEQHEAPFGRIAVIDSAEHPTSAPVNMAAGISYLLENITRDRIVVTFVVERAIDEQDISDYVIYWGGNNAEKLPLGAKNYRAVDKEVTLDHSPVINLLITSPDGKTIFQQGKDYTLEGSAVTVLNVVMENIELRVTYDIPAIAQLDKSDDLEIRVDIDVPNGATHFLVFTKNEFGEMEYGISEEKPRPIG